jgi:hypothetical protein
MESIIARAESMLGVGPLAKLAAWALSLLYMGPKLATWALRLEAGRSARLRSRSAARTARSRVSDAARMVRAGLGLAFF